MVLPPGHILLRAREIGRPAISKGGKHDMHWLTGIIVYVCNRKTLQERTRQGIYIRCVLALVGGGHDGRELGDELQLNLPTRSQPPTGVSLPRRRVGWDLSADRRTGRNISTDT